MKKSIPVEKVQIPNQQNFALEEEVSFVEIAKILVKKRWIFIFVFLFILGLGLLYSLLKEPLYDFKTHYHIASLEGEELPIQFLINQVEDVYIGKLYKKYTTAGLNGIPFSIEIDPLEKSKDSLKKYFTLTTKATKINQETIHKLHQDLIDLIQYDQNVYLETKKKIWTQQKEEASAILRKIATVNTPAATEKSIMYLDSIAKLENKLQSARPAYAITVAEPMPAKNKKIPVIIGSFIGGIFLGLLSVFGLHFISLVKISLQEDKERGL